MDLLLKILFVLTYTGAPAEDGRSDPSLLLRTIGGWDDIEAVDDAHLSPREPQPDRPCPALRKLRLAEAAMPDEEDEEIKRLHRMLWTQREWDQDYAKRIMPRYDRFFELAGEMMEEPEIRIEVPLLGATEPDDHFAILRFDRINTLRTRMHREGGSWEDAVASLEDHNRLANFVTESPGPMIIFLIGLSMERSMLESAEDLLDEPELSLAQVVRIREILEDGPERKVPMIRAWRHEYQYLKREVHNRADGHTVDSYHWWLKMTGQEPSLCEQLGTIARRCGQQGLMAIGFQPNRTIRRFAISTERAIARTGLPFAERIEDKQPPVFSSERGWLGSLHSNGFAKIAMKPTILEVSKVLDRTDHNVANRRAVLTICGVRSYWDQAGHMPEGLLDLVPAHLPAVPRDPYDGGAVKYSAEKQQVWVTGPDLEDNGGTFRERWPRFRANIPPFMLYDFDGAEGYDPTLQMRWMAADTANEQ